jgi:hypothetical protein
MFASPVRRRRVRDTLLAHQLYSLTNYVCESAANESVRAGRCNLPPTIRISNPLRVRISRSAPPNLRRIVWAHSSVHPPHRAHEAGLLLSTPHATHSPAPRVQAGGSGSRPAPAQPLPHASAGRAPAGLAVVDGAPLPFANPRAAGRAAGGDRRPPPLTPFLTLSLSLTL